MNWVAWRVQRQQLLLAIGAVAALVIWLVMSRVAYTSSWAQTTNHGFEVVLWVLPGLLGLALGASLVAGEIEHGTNRLAWSQSVSRTRWLSHKLIICATVTGLLTGALAPLVAWWVSIRWATPTGLTPPVLYIDPRIFGITGVVGIGFALLSLSLGTVLGLLVRHSGWAFAAGVPIVVALRLLIDGLWPTLVAPLTAVSPASVVGAEVHDGYLLQSAYLPLGTASPPPGQTWRGVWTAGGPWRQMRVCTSRLRGSGPSYVERFSHCASAAHLQLVVQYQPESHFWPLQFAEAAIFLGIATALVALAFAIIRYRCALGITQGPNRLRAR